MNNPFSEFTRRHDYLICIDSDGCAIDSMDIKHIRCFGPCMVEEWKLEKYRDEILARWNQINLYSMTRGINRFKGLAKALSEIDEKYVKIEDVNVLIRWTEESDELSNAALKKAAEDTENICLEKALRWSEAVNKAIGELPEEEVRPFDNVKETISRLHDTCDIAIVSSANYEAVKEEWSRFGILEYIDVLLAQNAGSKKSCIGRLLTWGYEKEHVMMVGDAPGDMEAAKGNGVFYYPILVGNEAKSWSGLEEAAGKLKEGTYGSEYQSEVETAFIKNLTA